MIQYVICALLRAIIAFPPFQWERERFQENYGSLNKPAKPSLNLIHGMEWWYLSILIQIVVTKIRRCHVLFQIHIYTYIQSKIE